MPRVLLPPMEAQARKREKHLAVLRWLSETIYSTPPILGRVMGLNTSAGWYTTLHRMEREELVMVGKVDLYGREISLWGITPHGQAVAHYQGQAPLSDRYFQPSRVAPTMLFHTLGLQKLHLAAVAAGWTGWSYRDTSSGKYTVDQYRPDAIGYSSTGKSIAIEYERTVKTPARYPQILREHLTAISQGTVEEVMWVSDELATLNTVARHILGIRELTNAAGERRTIGPQHHQRLGFALLNEFPETHTPVLR